MLKTEMRNERTRHIDQMSTQEMLKIISDENYNAVKAVEDALMPIGQAVDAISAAFANGGRMFYLGAGTSGRLGVLDAAECPPTFGVSAQKVVGLLAGGAAVMEVGQEDFEDSCNAAIDDLQAYNLTKEDIVVGISAAGGAAYVVSGMEFARRIGCVTIGLTSNPDTEVTRAADISIVTDTGAEVIAGSTRMKAGTAQKLVLNMLSTCAMIKSGYVYENLMINLQPSNKKLKKRMIQIVCDIRNVDSVCAEHMLEKADWNIRKAISSNDSQSKE